MSDKGRHDMDVDMAWQRYVDKFSIARHEFEMEIRGLREKERLALEKLEGVKRDAESEREATLSRVRAARDKP